MSDERGKEGEKKLKEIVKKMKENNNNKKPLLILFCKNHKHKLMVNSYYFLYINKKQGGLCNDE